MYLKCYNLFENIMINDTQSGFSPKTFSSFFELVKHRTQNTKKNITHTQERKSEWVGRLYVKWLALFYDNFVYLAFEKHKLVVLSSSFWYRFDFSWFSFSYLFVFMIVFCSSSSSFPVCCGCLALVRFHYSLNDKIALYSFELCFTIFMFFLAVALRLNLYSRIQGKFCLAFRFWPTNNKQKEDVMKARIFKGNQKLSYDKFNNSSSIQ